MYDENAEDEVTITVIATGLDAHGANTPVERAMKDFTNYKTKVPAQQAPVQRTAPSVKTPSEGSSYNRDFRTEVQHPDWKCPGLPSGTARRDPDQYPGFLKEPQDKILRTDKPYWNLIYGNYSVLHSYVQKSIPDQLR